MAQGKISNDEVASVAVGSPLQFKYLGVEFETSYKISSSGATVSGSDKQVPFWKMDPTSTLSEGKLTLHLSRTDAGNLPVKPG